MRLITNTKQLAKCNRGTRFLSSRSKLGFVIWSCVTMKQLDDGDEGQKAGSQLDFGFAFNDSNFSDRILKIEIVHDLPQNNQAADGDSSSIVDWASNRKRRREEKENGGYAEALVLENVDDVESLMGDETAEGGDSWSVVSSVVEVRTLHISSPILAAQSPFFYKLFSSCMRESEDRTVTLRVHESEEAALVDLLKYMYTNTLSATTHTALLDVLMAADKYEVVSCMRYCCSILLEFPMTRESALLFLELPDSLLLAEAVQPLTKASKEFLASSFKDIMKSKDEIMKLPLAGIRAVFSSDSLQVPSEDVVYEFVLKWARTHYPEQSDRKEVLGNQLCGLIRFSYMTSRKLKKILASDDLDPDLSQKIILDALLYKLEPLSRQRTLVAEQLDVGLRQYVERAYKYRPVKVVQFEIPHQQCIVYLNLTREECRQLLSGLGRIYSQAFHLANQGFFLSAHCNLDQQCNVCCFGLFLGMQERGSVSFKVDYDFSARQTTSNDEFVSKYKGTYTFTGGKAVGYRNLFGMPWDTFIAEDSIFFINDILHLRAELTYKS